MLTPLYKPLKKNGTTLYVFPGVAEDKNFETQNDNYKMSLSHFVLVNFPRQDVIEGVMDFETTFYDNATSIAPATFKDQLVESLRNYVANHETTIRNSKVNANTFYYDTFEPFTTTEKIFWKWALKTKLIDFEPADTTNDYFGASSKYDNTGPSGNTSHFREYLWKERINDTYSVINATIDGLIPSLTPVITVGVGEQYITLQLSNGTTFKPGDKILINRPNIDSVPNYSTTQSLLVVSGVDTTNLSNTNDTIMLIADTSVILGDLQPLNTLELYSAYERFVQYIGEISGVNNVQLADRAYTETFAHISGQHGLTPYTLWNVKDDNNYKPNLTFPILNAEIQQEIQGGEHPNNPILVDPSLYPGDIWAQFDNNSFQYKTSVGNVATRSGAYYGNYALSNIAPFLKWPDFRSEGLDGLSLNLNINDYAKAVSYALPIDSFNEFAATAFNNTAPKDFKFNAILWYYTIEDVTGTNVRSATNLYAVEFLDTPDNDIDVLKTKIPEQTKLVSNGLQDGNAFTFTLDTNVSIESGTETPTFDPDKVYSMFGMELYYEALTRITYFNDQLTTFLNSMQGLRQQVDGLTGLVYTQESVDSIRSRMNNLENLLTIYSTLQMGESDTIIPYLDTSVTPAVVRLNSIDKQYGFVYQFSTKDMFTEVLNANTLTEIVPVPKEIKVVNGKDFLVVINNNDNSSPAQPYDTTIEQDKLSITLEKDLFYKQKIDIIIQPKINPVLSGSTVPVSPFGDKKLDFYINYDDGITISQQLVKTFDLPVLVNWDGTNEFNETHTQYSDNVPTWKVRNVFYSKANTNDRIFSFVIEDDLISRIDVTDRSFIERLSRVFIENFLIEKEPAAPTNAYTDLSGQYVVYNTLNNPSYIRAEVVDIEIVDAGTGYPSGTLVNYPGLTNINIPGVTVSVDARANTSGFINEVYLSTENGLINPDDITAPGVFTIPGGAKVRPVIKRVTRIDIGVNININQDMFVLLTNYDNVTDVNTLPTGVYRNIDKYVYSMPNLTFLRGFKLSMVRISDTVVPFNNIEQRYSIQIEKI